MPTYMILFKWTPQGLKDIKQSPSRLDAGRKALEQTAGLKMKDFYMVTGRYDCMAIAEAPDDAALAKAILSITSQGSITTETCRAFTEAEYREIVAGLP
ncbi:MAG TPA: GYD domain-containing protein [Bryobacteraceae bacterium]|nr:GYD domain-containing protein [Bryobacteraceae bacterium]